MRKTTRRLSGFLAIFILAALAGRSAAAPPSTQPTTPPPTAAASQPASQPTVQMGFGSTIVEGTKTQTAHGGGTWGAWFNTAGARIIAANPEAIWFHRGCLVWRYNIKTQKTDAYTSSLKQGGLSSHLYGALSPKGQFVLSAKGVILLWEKGRWRRLPQPQGNTNTMHMGFDGKETLWAFPGERAFRWEGTHWGRSIQLPQHSGLWWMGNQWLMWNNYGNRKWKRYSFWNESLTENKELPKASEKFRFYGVAYQTPGGLVGVFGGYSGPRVLCKMDDSGFTEIARSDYVCLDLATGQGFDCVFPETSKGAVVVQDAEGKEVAKLPKWPPVLLGDASGNLRRRGVLLRDGNGDYWLGNWRCDGKTWRPVTPPNGFEFQGDVREAVRMGRLRYDPTKKAWVDACPKLPVRLGAYDPETRTGWTYPHRMEKRAYVIKKCHFTEDGASTSLAKVNLGRDVWTVPRFELDGDVWFSDVSRWNGKRRFRYPTGRTRSKSFEHGIPMVVQSPKGHVWMAHCDRFWQKFNPDTNKFIKAEPFDEFQFKAGERTLAAAGWPMDESWDHGSPLGLIHEKLGDKWEPMENSLLFGERYNFGKKYNRFFMVPGKGMRDGRMLVTWRQGVFEWDTKTNRWAFLAPRRNYWAFFDDQGRRVLVSNNHSGEILMYEGEPFAKGSKGEETPAGVKALLEKQLQAIIKDMNADAWAVRDAATQNAINLIRRHSRDVKMILNRPDWVKQYSPEVKLRVDLVLQEAGTPAPSTRRLGYAEARMAQRRWLGNSLLERMHSPPPVQVRYEVKVGMDFEQARSVFLAAGAKHSAAIHNKHYPDLSYQGFILPDNTMVYLRVENKNQTGKIVSMGLGEAGKGYDKTWDWSDAKRNGLNMLKLRPYIAELSSE